MIARSGATDLRATTWMFRWCKQITEEDQSEPHQQILRYDEQASRPSGCVVSLLANEREEGPVVKIRALGSWYEQYVDLVLLVRACFIRLRQRRNNAKPISYRSNDPSTARVAGRRRNAVAVRTVHSRTFSTPMFPRRTTKISNQRSK